MTAKVRQPVLFAGGVTVGPNAAVVVKSDPSAEGVGTAIDNIVALSQAQYDALTPSATTLYIVTDA